jgi:Uma2 family endonuclease
MSAKAALSKKHHPERRDDMSEISLVNVEPDWVFTLNNSNGGFSDEQFEQFCAANPHFRIEMTKEGTMIIMMPMVPTGGNREFLLNGRFAAWVEADQTGWGFSPSTVFTLPNGAKRSPDISWICHERWEALSEKQKNSVTHICPDFVIELRSKTDRLRPLQNKMQEYIDNGAQLGWLIDPKEKKVHVYRPDTPIEILDNPAEVSGEPLLPGFTLKLAGIID